jgi:hypothetical protein
LPGFARNDEEDEPHLICAAVLLRRSDVGWSLLGRRLHGFRFGNKAAHLVSRLERALDMFVVRFAFEEYQDVAVGALSCVAILDSSCSIPKVGIASGATKLN